MTSYMSKLDLIYHYGLPILWRLRILSIEQVRTIYDRRFPIYNPY